EKPVGGGSSAPAQSPWCPAALSRQRPSSGPPGSGPTPWWPASSRPSATRRGTRGAGPSAVGRRARASMVRRQRVGQRRGRAGSEMGVEGQLGVGGPGLGLAGGAREGLLGGQPVVDPAEAAVERLQRRQQQAGRDQAVSDDPEGEPGGLIPDVVPR